MCSMFFRNLSTTLWFHAIQSRNSTCALIENHHWPPSQHRWCPRWCCCHWQYQSLRSRSCVLMTSRISVSQWPVFILHLPVFCLATQRKAAISVYVHPPRKNTTVVVTCPTVAFKWDARSGSLLIHLRRLVDGMLPEAPSEWLRAISMVSPGIPSIISSNPFQPSIGWAGNLRDVFTWLELFSAACLSFPAGLLRTPPFWVIHCTSRILIGA